MPTYQFYCRSCRKLFSAFMTVKEHDERTAECPECHKATDVEKRVASVYVVTSKKS